MRKVNKKLTKIAVEVWGKYEKKQEIKMPTVLTYFENMLFEAFITGFIEGYDEGKKEKKDEKIS